MFLGHILVLLNCLEKDWSFKLFENLASYILEEIIFATLPIYWIILTANLKDDSLWSNGLHLWFSYILFSKQE